MAPFGLAIGSALMFTGLGGLALAGGVAAFAAIGAVSGGIKQKKADDAAEKPAPPQPKPAEG
jgi:hypothetical protein